MTQYPETEHRLLVANLERLQQTPYGQIAMLGKGLSGLGLVPEIAAKIALDLEIQKRKTWFNIHEFSRARRLVTFGLQNALASYEEFADEYFGPDEADVITDIKFKPGHFEVRFRTKRGKYIEMPGYSH